MKIVTGLLLIFFFVGVNCQIVSLLWGKFETQLILQILHLK